MSLATTVQNAIVTQLVTDTSIATEFTGKVAKGLGRNFNFNTDGQGIRVYLVSADQQFTDVSYHFKHTILTYLVTILFFEPDDAVGEERKIKYDDWVRKAIEKDVSFGGLALNTEIDNTAYKEDPMIDGSYFVVIPIIVQGHEATGAA